MPLVYGGARFELILQIKQRVIWFILSETGNQFILYLYLCDTYDVYSTLNKYKTYFE